MAGLDINTKLLLHGNAPDGTFEIIDSGNTGHVVTQVATAQLDTTVKKFGSSSLLLDGNSDKIIIPNSTDFSPDAGDYTWDFWIKSTDTLRKDIISSYDNNIDDFYIQLFSGFLDTTVSGVIFVAMYDDGANQRLVRSNVSVNDGLFHHVAITWQNSTNTIKIFVDGIEGQTTFSSIGTVTNITTTIDLTIGENPLNGGGFLNGHLEEIRLSKSVLRWTSNFTPPTTPHISDANTKLLLHMNTQDVSGDGGSGNFHIPDFIGTAQIDTAQSKFGGSSYLFDGNSDKIIIPNSTDFSPDAGDYTWDFWIQTTDTLIKNIISSYDNAIDDFYILLNPGWGEPLGGFGCAIYDDTANHRCVRSNVSVNDGLWHHVAITWENSTNTIKIFVDGLEGQTTFASPGTVLDITTTIDLEIGENPLNGGGFFNGHLDEIRLSKGILQWTSNFTPPTEEYSLFQQLNSFNANQSIIIT